jgi:sec-independent protein translocase protein TatA
MDPHPVITVGFGLPSGFEWVVIMVIGLLLFGRNLPSVMRGLGGSVKEFKKGMEEGVPTPPADPANPPPALPPPTQAPQGVVSRPATAAPQSAPPPAPPPPQP